MAFDSCQNNNLIIFNILTFRILSNSHFFGIIQLRDKDIPQLKIFGGIILLKGQVLFRNGLKESLIFPNRVSFSSKFG